MATLGKRLTDPTFRYVRSEKTDLRKTFARIRREQEEAKKQSNIQPIIKRKVTNHV